MTLNKKISLLLKKRQSKGLEVVAFHAACLLLMLFGIIMLVYELNYITHWLFSLALLMQALSYALLAWQIKKTNHMKKGRQRLFILSLVAINLSWLWGGFQQMDISLFYATALLGNMLVNSQRKIVGQLFIFILNFIVFRLLWWWAVGTAYATSIQQNIWADAAFGIFFALAAFGLAFILKYRIQQQKAEGKDFQGQLVSQKQVLTNTGQQLGILSLAAAHNLKSPVLGMRMLLKMFDKVDDAEREKIKKQMEDAIDDFSDIVDDFSGILADFQQLKDPRQRLNLEMELQTVIEDLKPQINATGAKISYDFSRLRRISYSQAFLRSLFHELIANALKFHKEGQIPEIKLSASRTRAGNTIRVSDNGIGINLQEDREQIFKLYGKLTDVNNNNSRGVGLYKIKNQVELSGGSLSIRSKPGEGTTFEILLNG